MWRSEGPAGCWRDKWLEDGDGWRVLRVKEAPVRDKKVLGPMVIRAVYPQIRSLRGGEKFTLGRVNGGWRVTYRDKIVVRPLDNGTGGGHLWSEIDKKTPTDLVGAWKLGEALST
jgi:hypothetical protein